MEDTESVAVEQVSESAVAEMEAKARALKTLYIDGRIDWYRAHASGPRAWFRLSGTATIIMSASLPAIAAAQFRYQAIVISVLSVGIAVMTGVSAFYKWEGTWRAYSTAQMALQQHIAKWELELSNAKLMTTSAEQAIHIYRATNDLLVNAGSVVTSESEGFFSGLSFPQQNSAGKG